MLLSNNALLFPSLHDSPRIHGLKNGLLQRDPGGLVQGFVDLNLGCSTILLGQ